MTRPNIFKFATTELSQDAFLCYVLDFYKNNMKTYNQEYEFSTLFLKTLLQKLNLNISEIKSFEVKKQYLSIDILLIINDNIFIIIEDKINTHEGKNQLSNYKEKLIERSKYKASKENIFCIYYKTGDESYANLTSISERENTCVFNRGDIIDIFKQYNGENIIFQDYFQNLLDIQEERDSFKSINLLNSNFSWNEIIGFYHDLDKELVNLKKEKILDNNISFNWVYVPNQSGGFMCFYFPNILKFQQHSFYLQLECISSKTTYNDNLKLTIKCRSDEKNTKLLSKGLNILKNNFITEVIKPSKFAKGKTMTQAIIPNWLVLNESGHVDTYETAKLISKYLESLKSLKPYLENLS